MNMHLRFRRALLLTLCSVALACGGKGSSGLNHGNSIADAGSSGNDDTGGGGAGPGNGGSSGDSWTNPDFCPDQPPTASEACGEAAASCHYDGQQCACIAGEWACNPCPDKAPEPAARCDRDSAVCQYTERACFCAEAQWLCLSDDCPDTKPLTGDVCPTEGAACPYQSASCACFAIDPSLPPMWVCIKNAGCPDQQPTSGTACEGLMLCEYGGILCGCIEGQTQSTPRWSCM
jgi:hypothetical protein